MINKYNSQLALCLQASNGGMTKPNSCEMRETV